MRTVEMNLRSDALSAAMAEMRVWLDERRYEPAVFSSRGDGAGVAIRVDFSVASEAEAFAGRFNGRLQGSPAGGEPAERRRDFASLLPAAGVVR